jgi:Ca-activated chloride channel family protein
MITVDAPFFLALAPLVGLGVAVAGAWVRGGRVRRAHRWSEEAGRTARAAGRRGPAALGLAALLVTLALAGPRWGDERVVAETRGLNLVLAVDISRSMLAEDAAPSRLGRVLREARRLVLDLSGDRLGLIAFAGTSYILSPLSPDGSAVTLHLDALEPDIASEGGTALARALRQGGELLGASPELADRVLVVFTDGEAHDSLPGIVTEAGRLEELGMRVIVVAAGGRVPARIPLRDARGTLRGYQVDEDGEIVETRRRDDVLRAIAEAAQGTLVPADLPDQAGAVRDLVAAYKRARSMETRTQRGSPRAWVPTLAGVAVLLAQALTRRTAALAAFALMLAHPAAAQQVTAPRTAAERAWDGGRAGRAAELYAAEAARGGGDVAHYNAGTAALAAGDAEQARASLDAAARSLDPDVRFRALYNLGWLHLDLAARDSVHRDAYLGVAERVLREALRLRPADAAAKWNLELTTRQRRGGGGGGGGSPPPSGGSGKAPPSPGGGADPPPAASSAALSQAQAEEILRAIGQEELETRRSRAGRGHGAGRGGGKDW